MIEATIREQAASLRRAITGETGIPLEGMSAALFFERLHAVITKPDAYISALNELGRELSQQGHHELARTCYRLAATDPNAIGAHANLGHCENRLGLHHDAEARARSILASDPRSLAGWQLLGESLTLQQRYAEAATAYEHALSINPELLSTHWLLARAYEQAEQLEAACATHALALGRHPYDEASLRALVVYKRWLCDWHELDALSDRLSALVEARRSDISPMDFLAEGRSAALEQVCASHHATALQAAIGPHPTAMEKRSTAKTSARLRVGFVSCGFGNHPTAILTSALFERLRASMIEVHLFSSNTAPPSAAQRRLAAAAYRFHHVGHLPASALSHAIRTADIEILIDLDGYSRHRKPQVFAHRPAPIQINWLGYPGTLGARFIDYVIADPYVLPNSLQSHFTEKVVYLPRCYQPTDPTRVVSTPPSREACGLPAEAACVYVCFNATYKLNPRSFTRMLRILRAVPDSVLWLLKGPGLSEDRLRSAAATHGIDSRRLIFMHKQNHEDYLARYRHADLFLDTEHYNAHTTASDALWAGCPVLSRPGDTFATRVAGSLNHYLGMDEMNAHSDEEFVAQAIKYGLDPAYREALRTQLAHRKQQSGLFDVDGYAHDFAALLLSLAVHHRAAGLPHNFVG